jgi:hypothetical protein
VGADDFTATGGSSAEISAQASLPVFLRGKIFRADVEKDFVADETQEAFAGGGGHDWDGPFHVLSFKFPVASFKRPISADFRDCVESGDVIMWQHNC